MSYQIQTHPLLQTRTGLYSLANQYIPHDSAPEGPALVFAHSTSNHVYISSPFILNCFTLPADKEQWEIIIGKIVELLPGRINEVWAIDWQNHGNSAVLNDHALQTKTATIEDYADILRSFVESHYVAGKKIIAIGHSTGTCAWQALRLTLTLAIFQISLPVSPIAAVILFEPVHILPPVTANDDRILKGKLNVRGVQSRQTTFASREEASIWARKRVPWKIWDDRMFQCYLQHGFRPVKGSSQVTTSCSASQEMWQCEPNVPIIAGYLYPKLCTTFAVHGIFGERPEMYSNVVRDRFFDGKEGRSMATVQIIPKAGHLLVQEKPDTPAETIVSILREAVQPGGKARL
ncbi:Alpha/Beta hydrolase protein [Mycena polygramma]|nr:Alpha/Beta hydrolase protein [Mycena polygramma]